MKELHVQAAHLTAMTMDAIFAQTVALVNGQPTRGRSGDVRLVLGSVKFIDPYGLVGLWGVLRYLARRFRTILVVPPVERDLQAYLKRMNFPAALADGAGLETELTGRSGSGAP